MVVVDLRPDPVLAGGSGFYIPFTADPVVSKTAFTGSESVEDLNAGGDKDFLENNCNVLGGPSLRRAQHRRRLWMRRLDEARPGQRPLARG